MRILKSRVVASDFETYIKEAERLQELNNKLSKKLNEVEDKLVKQKGLTKNMGLTPDSIKNDPKWKKAKMDFDKSFVQMQRINKFVARNFKKELRKYHEERRKKKYGFK